MNWSNFFREQLEGISPYQPGLREEQIRQKVEVSAIHKLSSNESPYPPLPAALAAMEASLHKLNEYPDAGCLALKQGLSARYGVPCEHIMVGNGTNELLMLLAQAALTPGSRVAYCWPSFIVYRLGALVAGAHFDEAPLTADGCYNLDALLELITPQTKLVVLCSPNNPTGGIITQEEFERFLLAVPPHVLVVVDLAYEEFNTSPQHLNAQAAFDGERPLVLLRTFSKIYGLAGARVGFGFAPVPVVEALDKLREPFNVNSVAQAAALACLGAKEELQRRQLVNARQRAVLYEAFDRLGLRYYRSEANFVWVFVDKAEEAFEHLLRRGVIVRSFAGGGGLRVGIGTEEATRATIDAFEWLVRQA